MTGLSKLFKEISVYLQDLLICDNFGMAEGARVVLRSKTSDVRCFDGSELIAEFAILTGGAPYFTAFVSRRGHVYVWKRKKGVLHSHRILHLTEPERKEAILALDALYKNMEEENIRKVKI